MCEKRYVFNPQAPQNFTPANNGIKIGTPWGGFRDQTQQAALKFNPAGKCPVYEVQSDVLMALKEKQQKDNAQIASLSNRVSAAPIKTGRDGGMHPTFLAKLKPQEIREPDGTDRATWLTRTPRRSSALTSIRRSKRIRSIANRRARRLRARRVLRRRPKGSRPPT